MQVFSPKSMIFLKEIVVFLQNRPPSAGGRLKCVEICFQNRFLADLSVCRLKCVGTVLFKGTPPKSQIRENKGVIFQGGGGNIQRNSSDIFAPKALFDQSGRRPK